VADALVRAGARAAPRDGAPGRRRGDVHVRRDDQAARRVSRREPLRRCVFPSALPRLLGQADGAPADSAQPNSPHSAVSALDTTHTQEKAERLLAGLVTLLSSSRDAHRAFSTALPLTRICLLLLGAQPSPAAAEHVLDLVTASIEYSASFVRKFELVSGWTFLKTVLPSAWSANVQAAALRVLLGRTWEAAQRQPGGAPPAVVCPAIFPAVLASLEHALPRAASQGALGTAPADADAGADHEALCASLLEVLIHLQAASATFRELFRSAQNTAAFVHAFKAYVGALGAAYRVRTGLLSLLDKLKHFGLTLALDNAVSGAHKREVGQRPFSSLGYADARATRSFSTSSSPPRRSRRVRRPATATAGRRSTRRSSPTGARSRAG
jgi:hypothetical protein